MYCLLSVFIYLWHNTLDGEGNLIMCHGLVNTQQNQFNACDTVTTSACHTADKWSVYILSQWRHRLANTQKSVSVGSCQQLTFHWLMGPTSRTSESQPTAASSHNFFLQLLVTILPIRTASVIESWDYTTFVFISLKSCQTNNVRT